jgi:N-carbamoyl-L-amino-acid hydrolase
MELTIATKNSDPPAIAGQFVMDAIADACLQAGYRSKVMISRAYHDSLFMARLAPISMIFIPCRSGFSHRPDEYSSPEQIAKGVDILARTLAKLAG